MVIDVPLRLGQINLDDLDVFRGQWHKSIIVSFCKCSTRADIPTDSRLHVLRPPHHQRLQHRLNHIQRPHKVLRLKWHRDEGPPERKVVPRLHAEEPHKTKQVLEPVDDGSAGEHPPVLRREGVACLGRLGPPVFDRVRLVKDNAEEVEREEPGVLRPVALLC